MRYFIFLLLLSFSVISWSQDDLTFLFKGVVENQDLGKKESGVSIAFVQSGSTLFSTTSNSSGRYTLKGDANYKVPFTIVFAKGGLVSKKVQFDFSRMHEEDIPPTPEFRPMEALDMTMFKERENADFSFLLSEPVAKIDWDTRQMTPRLDQSLVDEMKIRILKLIAEADKDKAEGEVNYQKAITEADRLFAEESYEQSLAKYEEALSYKPAEQYPADKIIELDALIQAQKAAELQEKQENEVYYNLIEEADALRDQDQLSQAVSKYQEALSKKDEQYPKDQISTLNELIEARKKEAENQQKYDEAVERGDSFLAQNSLRAAKDKFVEASQLKPSETYPIEKIKEIEEKLKAQEEVEANKKKYDEALAAADSFFDAENYTDAKLKYEEALSFENSSTYAKERISLCDEKLNEQNAANELAEKINALVEEGNSFMQSENWENAKLKFTEVLSLEQDHEESTEKLALIELEILKAKELADQEAADLEKKENYEAAITAADHAFNEANWDEASAKYREALVIDDTQAYPTERLSLIEEKIAEEKANADKEAAELAKKESYDAAILAADNAFNQANWDEASAKYREALVIDDTQAYPTERLSLIEEKIAEEKANADKEAAELAKKDSYDAAILAADNAFNQANWDEASAKYREALTIDDSQSYPTERLSLIEEKIAEEKANADKEAAELAKKESYDAAILAADNAFNQTNWDEASAKYREALSIDDSQSYPTERLSLIEEKIAEEKANADQEAADLAQKESYDATVLAADKAFNEANWDEASAKYREAFVIDDTQSYPTERLSLIEEKIAEEKANADKEAAELLKKEQYDAAILVADNAFNASNWDEASSKYREALTIDDTQSYPVERLSIIEQKIAEAQSLSAKDTAYNNLLSEAETSMTAESYTEAISKLEEAKILKPEESFPAKRIQEIKVLIDQKEADAKNDAEYKALMNEGDALLSNREYLAAISKYNQALVVKPGEQEPVDKAEEAARLSRADADDANRQYEKIITLARKKMDEANYPKAIELLNRAKGRPSDPRPDAMLAEIVVLKARDAKYNKLMSEGESLGNSKKYDGAIAKFKEAGRVKSQAVEPTQKIIEMKALKEAMDSEAKKNALFKDYMDKGAFHFGKRKFDEALSNYQNALNVKENDVEASAKINEIQQILDNLSNQRDAAIELQNNFDAIVKDADIAFSREEYQGAVATYEEALLLIPDNEYVQGQIDESKRQIEVQGIVAKEKEYTDLINAANLSFDNTNYEDAKSSYEAALLVKPNQIYPTDRLREIELIQNPVSVNSGSLEDLGDPFDSSIMDGSFILAKAESERKALKKTRIEEKLDGIQEEYTSMTNDNTLDAYATSNDIYEVYKLISIEAGEEVLGQQELAERLRKAKLELKKEESLNAIYENATSINDQLSLYDINEKSGTEYIENVQDQEDLAVTLRTAKLELENEVSSDNLAENKSNINDQLDLYEINEKSGVVYIENVQGQEDLAVVLRKSKLELQNEVSNDTWNDNLANVNDQLRLYDINEQSAIEYNEKEAVYSENTDVMNRYNTSAAEARSEDVYADYAGNVSSDQELIDIRSKFDDGVVQKNKEKMISAEQISDVAEYAQKVSSSIDDKNRNDILSDQGLLDEIEKSAEEQAKIESELAQDNNEVLKRSQEELANAHSEDQASENRRNIDSKLAISEETKTNEDINKIAKEAHDGKVASIKTIDDQAMINNVEAIKGDKESRLSAEKNITDSYDRVSKKNDEEMEASKENSISMTELDKTESARRSAENLGQQDKHYDAQSNLNKVSNTPQKKPIVKNSMGKEYPEGVSQESFTRSDNNGLVTTIITRRIVVVEGRADVYVRTQSMHGITYSKNGNPSLSNVWSKETQGPHLERHF